MSSSMNLRNPQLSSNTYLSSSKHTLTSASDDSVPSYVTPLRIMCGSMSGAVTKTAIAPLERIKIIHQTQGMHYTSQRNYHSITQSIRYILQTEGVRSFWNGNGANVLRVIPNYGLRFSFNDKARELVLRAKGITGKAENNAHQLNKKELFIAGSLAGMAQITITYPAEVIFTRLTLSGAQVGSAVKYNGIFDCISKTLRYEGVRTLYNGYGITMLSGTPFVALQMSLYEIFQRQLSSIGQRVGNSTNVAESVPVKLTAGAIASLIAQTVTFPGDVVRRRLQSDGMGGKPRVYTGMIDACKSIYKKEGVRGFFQGAKVNSWRCLPEGAIMFFAFDLFKKWMNIAQYDRK